MIKKSYFFLLSWLLVAGCRLPSAHAANPYAGRFYASGDAKKAEFALTFDDGPGYITEDLLKLLEERGAKAAFFMLGSSARAYPARARKVQAAGHLVANHTDTHKNWFKIGNSADRESVLAKEIEKTGDAIENATGSRPVILRMPNGYDRPWVRRVAAKLGYTLVNWTYGSDWTKISEEEMTAGYLKAVKPGAILLMHDGGGKVKEKNLRITGAVLLDAGKKGLKPVRLDEFLGIREAAESGGKR